MKKLKIMLAGLLAVAMPVMTACVDPANPGGGGGQTYDEPKVSGISLNYEAATISVGENISINATVNKTGDISSEVTWTIINESVATIISQDGNSVTIAGLSEGIAYLKATSKGDATVFKSATITVVTPAVNSVEASASTFKLGLGLSEDITVNVDVTGTAAHINEVTWSVDNTDVVEIVSSDNTKVTLKGLTIGTATLTVKSKFDVTKQDTVAIEVVDKGFEPMFYDEGFEYKSTGYPTDEVKAFFGDETLPVFAPTADAYADGSYYLVTEETDEEYASVQVIGYALDDESYYDEFEHFEAADEGFNYYFDSNFYVDFLIDDSLTSVTVFDYVEGDDEEEFYLNYSYYKASDLYEGSNTATADDAWDEEYLTFFERAFGTANIPFLALGEDYQVDCALNDEDYGTYFQIFDFSANFELGNALGQTLTDNGFVYDANNYVYTKPVDDINSINVYIGFMFQYGNFIDISLEPTVFSTFPETFIDTYVSDTIESSWEAIPFEATSRDYDGTTSGPEYRAEYGYDDNIGEYARVSGLYMNLAAFNTYVDSYVNAGFTLVYEEEGNAEEFTDYMVVLQKGKLFVQLDLYGELSFDDAGYVYSFDNGTIDLITFTADGTNDNFWLDADYVEMYPSDEPVTVTANFAGIDGAEPTVTWASEDEEVCTVEGGVITAVGAGETTVTATANINGSDVTLSVDVYVEVESLVEEVYFSDYLSDGQTLPSFTTEGGVKVAVTQNGGSSPAKYYGNDGALRLYAKNQITITAPEGHAITGVYFYNSDYYGDKSEATVTANTGNYSDYTWTGEATSVTFTLGSTGQFRITGFDICLDGDPNDIGQGSGGETTDEAAEEFVQELLGLIFGDEVSLNNDYYYDADYECYYTFLECENLTDDIDDLYDFLSGYYDCTEPEIDSYNTYDFIVYSNDGLYFADIYSDTDEEGNYIEIDFYSTSVLY